MSVIDTVGEVVASPVSGAVHAAANTVAGFALGNISSWVLAGKVAIVTGAGSGIGAAGAQLFARGGARVAIVDVHEDGLQATAEAIRRKGGEALPLVADVSDLSQVQTMTNAVIGAYDKIDVLWNNAGIVRDPYTPIEDTSVETWHQVLGVNLHGVFFAC
jgi:3-oxoacyl-[acyl-carrier protein] reductase